MGKSIAEVYWALQGTQEGWHSCLLVGATAKFIRCSCSVPYIHASEVHSSPNHVVDCGELVVDADETVEEGPMRIMDNQDQVLRGKTMRLVKVLWRHQGVEEAT